MTAILAWVPRPVWYALAGLAAIGAAFWAGGHAERNACDARIEAARATTTQDILSQIQEGSNAKVEAALAARLRAERDFDSHGVSGGVRDDPYLRPDD